MIIKSKIKINSNYISYIYTHENNSHLALLLHGFGSDMHEKGNFDTLSEKLLQNDIDSLRFDYLGHGESDGHTEDLTMEIAINEALTLLKKYPHAAVLVTGCYAELDAADIAALDSRVCVLPGSRKDLLAEIPGFLKQFLVQPEVSGEAAAGFLSGRITSLTGAGSAGSTTRQKFPRFRTSGSGYG